MCSKVTFASLAPSKSANRLRLYQFNDSIRQNEAYVQLYVSYQAAISNSSSEVCEAKKHQANFGCSRTTGSSSHVRGRSTL